MTKLEMITDILKHTGFAKEGLDKGYLKTMASSLSKSRVEQVYKLFLEDKEHASYYFMVL